MTGVQTCALPIWLQNHEMCLGRDETAEDIRKWITELEWEGEDAISFKFVNLLVAVVQGIHASGLLKEKFGREIPVLIHELEYHEKISQQNIEANGETLNRDFVSFCMSCLPEVPNEMPKAENPVTAPQPHSLATGKRLYISGKAIAFIIAIVLITGFWVLGLIISIHDKSNSEDTPLLKEGFEEETSVPLEQEKTESGQRKWQVHIQPGMPEPFIEVLRQYEQFMNADIQNLNDEDVREKIDSVDGKWRYLYDELCGSWLSAAWRGEEDVIRYSLEDLTGDGYPELVMGYCRSSDDAVYPGVVYYYSRTDGIRMECLSSYYTMELYEDGVILYVSGGAAYTETFIQFQEEAECWQQVACIAVDCDYETDSVRGYYWGDDVSGDLTGNRPMSAEEYQKIIAQYAAEPVALEWTSLIRS